MFTDFVESMKLNASAKKAIKETFGNWKAGLEIWAPDLRTLIQVGEIGVSVDVFKGRERHDSVCKCVNGWKTKTAKQIIFELEH